MGIIHLQASLGALLSYDMIKAKSSPFWIMDSNLKKCILETKVSMYEMFIVHSLRFQKSSIQLKDLAVEEKVNRL